MVRFLLRVAFGVSLNWKKTSQRQLWPCIQTLSKENKTKTTWNDGKTCLFTTTTPTQACGHLVYMLRETPRAAPCGFPLFWHWMFCFCEWDSHQDNSSEVSPSSFSHRVACNFQFWVNDPFNHSITMLISALALTVKTPHCNRWVFVHKWFSRQH